MPIVLVVDDNPVDQKLVGGLLELDVDWLVSFADNVETAVETISDISPDIFFTDLQIPGMSGLELLKIAREKFPHTPVVLMTGKGSEELAVKALHEGAASYVPKSAMATTLAVTVLQILSLAEHNKNKDRLLAFTSNCRYQFKMDSDPKLIPPLIDFVGDAMSQLHLADLILIWHVAVAIEEAVVNAMFHGNFEFDSDQVHATRHALPGSEAYELLESRMNEEPFSKRRIFFGLDVSRNHGKFAVRDQGPGFDVNSLPDLTQSSSLTKETNRGLTLINNFIDEVTFNDAGNEIRMSLNY